MPAVAGNIHSRLLADIPTVLNRDIMNIDCVIIPASHYRWRMSGSPQWREIMMEPRHFILLQPEVYTSLAAPCN